MKICYGLTNCDFFLFSSGLEVTCQYRLKKYGIDCSTRTENTAIRSHIESYDNSCDEYNEHDNESD
jgi:hypothetical protein